ncbi:uncharacterized protein LOC128551628 [Mercenaria mercenaria]|uniref:uncharacterized protein LOC128551628 n=1 Tax=Mercenaria mercenaria TaxID=6596 RepID=UPI00234F8557|nr:uncharacterized protein LOC128551628 [Mercenaria mercenaria]
MSSNSETVNWTKGCTGLTVTKIGLSKYIIDTWKAHLLTWKEKELSHLPEFFEDVDEGSIIYQKGTGNKKGCWIIKCQCQSGLCQKILDRLRDLHGHESRKIVWKTMPEEQSDQTASDKKKQLWQLTLPTAYPFVSEYCRVCSICKSIDCPFERHRNGVPLFDYTRSNSIDSHFLPFTSTSIFQRRERIVDEYYWKIANMFMFRGTERNEIPNTGPEDTDTALVFKMMKYCKLFSLDGDEAQDEVYDDLLEVRNFLMHTTDNRLSDEALEECFTRMKTVLETEKFSDTFSTKAVAELSMLKSMSIYLTTLTSEEADIVKQAFAEQQSALKYDIHITRQLKNDYVLEGLLKVSVEKCKEYTQKYEQETKNNPVERHSEEHRNPNKVILCLLS